ncbi:unnamed protein product, partial [Ilex paraguariensis]
SPSFNHKGFGEDRIVIKPVRVDLSSEKDEHSSLNGNWKSQSSEEFGNSWRISEFLEVIWHWK